MGVHHHKVKLSSRTQQSMFRQAAERLPNVLWQQKAEQYCEYRLDGKTENSGWLRVKQFTNGTLYLEASQPDLLDCLTAQLPAALRPSGTASILVGASPTATAQKAVGRSDLPRDGFLNLTGTYLGTDESGKGDYFGPLVVAGVVVTEEIRKELAQAGIVDSKTLNDATIAKRAQLILDTVGADSIALVEIFPERYNALYESMRQQKKNLNHLLAWAHATAIETLLTKCPHCQTLADVQAVADQFGSPHYIQQQLRTRGQQIVLHQVPRAEANLGVAAASIVARHRFVIGLERLSAQVGVALPLGAGAPVLKAAKNLVKSQGRSVLRQVAKYHFKTTQDVLGPGEL
ncbi:MAG: ribonuclease HIII [Candidatus Melainabacteria bacterium]|nr:ribonuclease HIII [Candidatus Melainabacteria bacterium]